jgi:putative ABC transport system permease protein
MNIYKIAFNNIIRKKGRMLLTVSGLMAGVAIAVVLYITVDTMRLTLGDQIDEFGANIVIIPHTEGMEISYGGTHITNTAIDRKQLSEADLVNIANIPDYNSINIVSPKIVAATEVNGRKILLVGVEPEKEFIMKRWFSLSAQSNLAAGAVPGELALLELPQNGLIAGADTARTLNLQAGDSIEISGQKFIITGILNPLGSVEDGLLFGNLLAVQNLLGRPGEISMIELSAYCNSCPIEEIAAQLSEALPNGKVTALRQAALLREETIDRFSLFAFLLTAVILLIAALMVLTTMMSSVYERTREIGILRAIGFRGSHVMKVILLEAGLTGLLGGLAGFTVGTVVARYFGSYLAGISVQVSWQISLLLPALALAIFIALAAAVIPAKRAANLDPVEALRFI